MALAAAHGASMAVRIMAGEGENILTAIHQIRDIHRSVSLLLMTAGAAMTEKDWENARSSSAAIQDMSWAINQPEKWMPWDVFRFYKHPYHPSILVSISVLLDDTEKRLSEPVLSAAIFDFGKGRPVIDFPNWLSGIYKVWSKERVAKVGRDEPERVHATRFAAFLYALYFSLLTAFHFGWRDLNVGNWIARMQRREYALRATGWVRVISGVQSLISVYLIAMWVLTYFGRPFE